MKQIVFIFGFLAAMLCVSCTPKKPILVDDDWLHIIYVEEPDAPLGRLYGLGRPNDVWLEPIWENLQGWDDKDDHTQTADIDIFLAIKGSTQKLFTKFGEPLCDSATVIGKPDLDQFGGDGIPGAFIKVKTEKGIYGIYHSQVWERYWEYGPYEDFFGGVGGFAFKQNGKWGIATYGDQHVIEFGLESGEYTFTKNSVVLVKPRFEKILEVRYVANIINWQRGWDKESDFTWYCYDGKQWHAYTAEGKSVPVRQAELQRALNLKVQPGAIYRGNRGERIKTQRRGTEEASIAVF